MGRESRAKAQKGTGGIATCRLVLQRNGELRVEGDARLLDAVVDRVNEHRKKEAKKAEGTPGMATPTDGQEVTL